MSTSISRTLVLLRKEKGISQKKASEELSISQALLSHYEKGIRECGLEFLCRAADFYGVSVDYLLGRSPEKNGAIIKVEDIPPETMGKENTFGKGVILTTLPKKLLANSLNVIFDMAAKTGNKEYIGFVTDYLYLSYYKLFRYLYMINSSNPASFFGVGENVFKDYTNCKMMELEVKLLCGAKGEKIEGAKCPVLERDELLLNQEILTKLYPTYANSILNVVSGAEKIIKK
ncbi:MAG: helix-turn-helix transcriptional regulator [Clostridia bacterium]|nr:helix-turn-helix transcriptional regulator [Clostridia bacterium]